MKLEQIADHAFVLKDLPDRPYHLASQVKQIFEKNLALPTESMSAVSCFDTLGLYFQPHLNINRYQIEDALGDFSVFQFEPEPGDTIEIPVCYEMGEDLVEASHRLGIKADDVISAHLNSEIVCFGLGFCPGFAYCDGLSPQISGLPRKSAPRIRVKRGSVGITGNMSAIYPLEKPGGWNLIGRTPLILVDVRKGYFPIQPGTKIRHKRIDEKEFYELLGTRVPTKPK